LINAEEIIDGNVTWNDKWSNRLDRSLSSVEDTVRLEKQAVNLVLEVKIEIKNSAKDPKLTVNRNFIPKTAEDWQLSMMITAI
jgi:hypothetical protein